METPTKVERSTAWLDVDIIKQAKAISAIKGDEKAHEILERIVRGPLAREYKAALAGESHDVGGES